MTQLPFEQRLGEWLEEGPARAPDAVLDTVLAAMPSIRQRRPRLVVGGRPVRLTRRLRFALIAAAALVVAVTGVRLFAPSTQVGGPGVELKTYRSELYRYSLTYPADWSVREATRALRADETPWDFSDAIDLFSGPEDEIIVAAATVTPGTTAEAWAASTTLSICGTPTDVEPTVIDHEPGRLYTYAECFGIHHLWAVVVRGGSAFHIVWLHMAGALEPDRDRVRFEEILATFTFTE